MNVPKIKKVLKSHQKWLAGEAGGERADLRGADLCGAKLREADLRGADLNGADLREADLSGAKLRCADLKWAYLSRADLREADLRRADLSRADLRDADLREANLNGAVLSDADLREADLSGADLSRADLRDADLNGAVLCEADLRDADLREADLSGATGLISPAQWLEENFDHDNLGVIVYKVQYAMYDPPKGWRWQPGEFLTEVANANRADDCGCGVNVATRAWCEKYYPGRTWKCRVHWLDLAGVVVPYNTDGKFRCERLELLERVS